jgi:hypothetical protein
MSFGDVLSRLLTGAGNTLQQYGAYTEQKRRADADDAFQQARMQQAEDELRQREQQRLRSESQEIAQGTARSLENAGIYGTAPALNALAQTQGNRVQGQNSANGAVQDYATNALSALHQASTSPEGLSEYQTTDLGDGRYFVPPNLGKPEKPVMGSEEWLSALSALAEARANQQIRVNDAKPQPASAARSADLQRQAEIDRYVSEAGGDAGAAMSRWFQQNRRGSAQSPEEAQAMSEMSTRFNSSAQNYRNKTVTGSAGGKASVKGKIPLSAVSKEQRRQWAAEAGIPANNDPANVQRMLEWIKANKPEVDVTLR